MNKAHRDHFSDLTIVTPCCDTQTTLDDLVYDWPQGFARWRVEVMNPDIGLVSPAQEQTISHALRHAVRLIYTHI